MTLRRVFGGSRVNRDKRDQSFARSVIAEATRRHNDEVASATIKEFLQLAESRGLCCMARHANATPPWTCNCTCHDEKKNTAILLKAGEIGVCPDCFGKGRSRQTRER